MSARPVIKTSTMAPDMQVKMVLIYNTASGLVVEAAGENTADIAHWVRSPRVGCAGIIRLCRENVQRGERTSTVISLV